MALVPCIAVSLGYILLSCLLAEALRKVIRDALPEGLVRTAFNEAVAAAELCACGFELIIGEYKLRLEFHNSKENHNQHDK